MSSTKFSAMLVRATALICGFSSLTVAFPTGASAVTDGGGRAQAGAAIETPARKSDNSALMRTDAAAAPPGYSIQGIDVSSHDHSKFPIDWPGVAASGVKFSYVKATEGQFYVNPYFHADNRDSKAAGILTGAYVFGRPDLRDPIGEANYFIDHAEWVNDARTLIPFLDLEWPYPALNLPACYGLSPTEMVSWIRSFVEQVRIRTGRAMMIYTNTNWWNPCTGNNTSFGDNPLDIAGWTNTPPPLPSGWNTFTLWQYKAGNNSNAGDYDRDVFNGDYAALTRLAGGAPALSTPIGFRAKVNNQFVTAGDFGRQPLLASRPIISTWELFDQVDAGGGYIALRSHANGLYVTADNYGNSPLIASRPTIDTWEKFKLVHNADGTVSLRALVNGKYVTADNYGNGALIASRPTIDTWEKFDKVDQPAVVSFNAVVNNKYVTAANYGRWPLIASAPKPLAWEQFDAVDAGGGYIALRSHANGLYVTADNYGNSPLIASRPRIDAWEKFSIITNSDGTVSLRALVNGKYVTADNAGNGPLIASRPVIDTWEKFYRLS